MDLFEWDISPDPNSIWEQEYQEKEGNPTTWQLKIWVDASFEYKGKLESRGYFNVVGKIEKPLGEERYYIGHAPPTDKELAREKKASEDGLHLCYHNTLQFRADNSPCESFDNLEKAQRVLALQVRRNARAEFERAQETLRCSMKALDVLDDILDAALE